MKKFFVLIVLALLISVFCVGCVGVYTPPIVTDPNQSGTGGGSGTPDTPGNPADPSDTEGGVFTVSLVNEDGTSYSPDKSQNLMARWTGSDDYVYEAAFDSNGKATHSGMDGDYRITLSNIPEGYTYNPNGIYANNYHKDVEVVLLKLSSASGAGDGLYSCARMTDVGTYRALLTQKGQKVYFEYTPSAAGTYYIESWVDVSANEINPYADYYNGTFAAKFFRETVDKGGTAGSYTKNFRLVVSCSRQELNNCFTFVVYADCISDELYNSGGLIVDFTISYRGEAIDPDSKTEVIEAQGPFLREYGDRYFDEEGSFHGFAEGEGNLDKISYKLNPDDGYYHIWNSDSGEYGPTIYVKLSQNTVYFSSYVSEDCDDAFLHNDYFHGEWAKLDEGHLHTFPLRLGIGDYNHKEEFYYKDYHEFMQAYTGYEPGDVNGPVYNDNKSHCNGDGAHPVNEELKTFLQEYAKHYLIFRDGDGGGEGIGLNSSEINMWLFACGIYE